ncbi:hypothetical protein [Chryseobacterium koreense]|uniref:Uncharacterized protein n=1 Tax=Chryseobacterium koreense CCUG 49689 TaxID=1304281 RepID=A0A0J7IPF6_9FLAO|nr:hypothetical protein [Chryseobacterium koreense]KMQ67784.1 hypothetical protein ACM44_14740 [Chryseobacterium koreense CCUG 49689]MBB5334877.1 hypothetical protein [Chryseobacterium koreense]
MGYIKEPKGVDFVIQSEPLTDKDRKEISEFIKKYKEKQKVLDKSKSVRGRKTTKKSENA